MARNIQIVRRPNGQAIIQIEGGAQFTSIIELCNDRALHKLSRIITHKIATLPHRPLKMNRPVDMMAALVTTRLGSYGPGVDKASVVNVFYRLVDSQHGVEDLIHTQLIAPFIQAYTRRFIRWYGASLQARGVALEG